jgi:hypothetical protein
MLPAPFYSELPIDLGDGSAWCIEAPAEQDASAAAQAAGGSPSLNTGITQCTNTLGRALRCFVWGYSTWS